MGRWRRRPGRLTIRVETEGSQLWNELNLSRECEAVQIPAGTPITLEKGIEVFITQSLGGTYTLQVPAYNGLYRIAGKDADAIGKTPEEAAPPRPAATTSKRWSGISSRPATTPRFR